MPRPRLPIFARVERFGAPPPELGPSSVPRREEARLALGGLLGIGGLVAVPLIVLAGGYGYHRDELYFLVAGDHLAWGYADQGPLTPFLAKVMDAIAPGSLTVLRVPSALMAGGTVILTGVIAYELGGRRRAQLIAASCAAVAAVVLVVGHLLSTPTFDLLAWSLVTWLVARVIRTGEQRLWAVAGLVAGLALLDKPLIAFLLAALGAGLLIAGPRRVLRGGWLWAGLVIALLIWSPWLLWQAGPRSRSPRRSRRGDRPARSRAGPCSRSSSCSSARLWRRCGSPGSWRSCAATACGRLRSSRSPGSSSSSSSWPRAASPTTWPACSPFSSERAGLRPTPGCSAGRGACAAPCWGAPSSSAVSSPR